MGLDSKTAPGTWCRIDQPKGIKSYLKPKNLSMQEYNCHILIAPEPPAFSGAYSRKLRSASNREHSIYCIKFGGPF